MNDNSKVEVIRSERKKIIEQIKKLRAELSEVNIKLQDSGFVKNGKLIEPKKNYLDIGLIKFQKKPKDGISYLIENQLVKDDEVSIAQFLRTNDVDKKALGEYLGDVGIEFNRKVLAEFVKTYDFAGKDFVESLREFFTDFILPGESQKIDEFVKIWGKHYYRGNPDVLNNDDEAYVLAYAVLMLNTTLHNETAARQNVVFGQEDVFVQDMIEYKDMNFRKEFIRDIYHTIKTKPLLNLINPVMNSEYTKNCLLKAKLWYQSSNLRQWQQRTFLLLPNQLVILHEDDKSIRYKIILENTKLERDFLSNRPHVLNLLPQNAETICAIKTSKNCVDEEKTMRSFRFAFNDPEELRNWEKAIREEIDKINEANNECNL